jgi:hypothetical protein
MTWTPLDIAEELDFIQQWGKSSVWGLTNVKHPEKGRIDFYSGCSWGTCVCPTDGFVYAWACWCTEGQVETTWGSAMSALEKHMFSGLHK